MVIITASGIAPVEERQLHDHVDKSWIIIHTIAAAAAAVGG